MYLDNGAICKPINESVDYALKILKEKWYNPNSMYSNGQDSKQIIEYTKKIIAKEINCNKEEIVFCSCGSEANSLATVGYLKANDMKKFITSKIEHSSIIENPYAEKIISVDEHGFFNMEDIKNTYDSLVSLQMANSEIGTIQDIKSIVRILHKNNCIVHTDAVAAFGKIPINVKDLDVDMLTATGQKIGGILGCAFLYKKKNVKIEPIIYGHNTLRGGTQNVPAIGALGKAIEKHHCRFVSSDNRDYLYKRIKDGISGVKVIGASLESDKRLPNNLYLYFSGCNGESLMLLLDVHGISVSTGSACMSGSTVPSYVLDSIGMDKEYSKNCIRISLNGEETKNDLEYVYKKLNECVKQLRELGK